MKVLALFVSGLLLVWLGPRASDASSAPTSDSTIAGSDTSASAASDTSAAAVPQRDAMDVLKEHVLHRRVEPEVGGTLPIGLSWAVLPSLSYNPVYGWAIGASVTGAGRLGIRTPRYSQLSISGNISTTGQILAQVRGELYGPKNNYLVKVDIRYLDTQRSTWGLGPMTADQEEYPMEFKLVRTYATLYRRTSGQMYMGVGYHYDEFLDIVDTRAQQGEATPFSTYSGPDVKRTAASGFSVDVLGDTRDNLVNASSGWYLAGSFRDYFTELGSITNWQELWVEMRGYPRVPAQSRNVLAFWIYAWTTFGKGPYLNLPSNGWDTYGRGARGYLQGRIRGTDLLYIEGEYRWALTRDGLWGAVVFLNTTTVTNPDSGIFGTTDYAGGVGLRIKFSKRTNTNLVVDQGWGRLGSKVLFLGMTETF